MVGMTQSVRGMFPVRGHARGKTAQQTLARPPAAQALRPSPCVGQLKEVLGAPGTPPEG